MYVKIMHKHTGNDFEIIEIFKGQRASFWTPPGRPMQLQVIGVNGIESEYQLIGPAYVMSDDGKTIASYGVNKAVEISQISANQKNEGQGPRCATLGAQLGGVSDISRNY